MNKAEPNGAESGLGVAPTAGPYTPGNVSKPDTPITNSEYSAQHGAAGQPNSGYPLAPPVYAQQQGCGQQNAQQAQGFVQQPLPIQQTQSPLVFGLGLEFVWCAPFSL